MINVYLDDLRPCPKGFVLAKNIEECILLLEENDVNILSLDFDLGWNEPTGYDLTKMMVDKKRFAKEIYLHTSDSNGRMEMYHLIYQHKPDEVVLHNGPMPYELLEQYL